MGREQALLTRLAARESPERRRDQRTADEDLTALMDSVREHLTRLLNARHGMSEALPDYGLPAMSDLTIGRGDYVLAVQSAIQTTIEAYEPRLRRVRVNLAPQDDEPGHASETLTFRVDAVMVSQSGEHRVWYETQLTGQGEFDVLG